MNAKKITLLRKILHTIFHYDKTNFFGEFDTYFKNMITEGDLFVISHYTLIISYDHYPSCFWMIWHKDRRALLKSGFKLLKDESWYVEFRGEVPNLLLIKGIINDLNRNIDPFARRPVLRRQFTLFHGAPVNTVEQMADLEKYTEILGPLIVNSP